LIHPAASPWERDPRPSTLSPPPDLLRLRAALPRDTRAATAIEMDKQSTLLHLATAIGHVDGIKLLTGKGCDADKADGLGRRPLHLAALYNKAQAVQVLLKHGADADAEDKDGQTPEQAAEAAKSKLTARVFKDPVLCFWNRTLRANRLYKAENFQQAFALYEEALTLVEKGHLQAKPPTPGNLATLYLNCAKSAQRTQQWVKAVDFCGRAINSLGKPYPKAVEVRAECFTLLTDYKSACSDYKELIAQEASQNVDEDDVERWRDQLRDNQVGGWMDIGGWVGGWVGG
jgi:ankyrin repeat protein